MFDGMSFSQTVSINGRHKRYPSRADYLQWLQADGQLQPGEAIGARAVLAEAIYRHWQGLGQLACRFAQELSKDPGYYGMATAVIRTGVDGHNPFEEATLAWEAALADPTNESLTLLFPDIDTPEGLITLLHGLGLLAGCFVRAVRNPSDRFDRVYIQLQAPISKGVVAEVLGFAPFEFLPVTRRAPLVALEARTKSGRNKDGGGPHRPERTHLARIPLDWEPSRIDRTWKQTELARMRMLGGDDSAAKAKVTFAVPIDVWESSMASLDEVTTARTGE